jgi:hypothetical protein
MNRHTVILFAYLLALCTLAQGCREVREEGPSRQSHPAEETNEKRAPRPEPSPASAFDAADQRVEAARILALPLEPLSPKTIQGIALPTYTELPDLSYEQMLDRIQSTGASHVSIVTSWNQQTIYHNRLRPDPDKTPDDAALGELIDDAHARGLKTMLFPIIHVERRATGEWRGKLAPTDTDRWRQEYRTFILHHAELAQRHGVEILSIGSELSSQESDTAFWTKLLKDVREKYEGELLYSANWDHYETPQFWDELDYVGVSSYFEVARRADEPIHAVTARWYEHRDELVEFSDRVGKPLLLTEVGYPSVDTAAVKPWDYTARTPPNPGAQLAAYRSLTDAWVPDEKRNKHFAGLFLWHGWGHGGPDDTSYPIWGKSAERLVRRWYALP